MSESRRDALVAVRGRLEAALAACESSRDLPALSREYRATLAELDALPSAEEVSAADEIAKRRATRQASPHPKSRASNEG